MKLPAVETVERNELRIDVQVKGVVDARQIAKILNALDRSFSAFVRTVYGIRGAHLGIARTGTGSWWAYLTAGKELYDLAKDCPDLVPIFAQNIDVALRAALIGQQDPGESASYARQLLKDLAKAGKKLGADAIELASITKVVISASFFEKLEILDNPRIDGHSVEDASLPRRMLTDRNAVLHAAKLAQKAELIGTVFKVADGWYVRAEGMFGVLIPLRLTVQPKLAAGDGERFAIEGTLLRSPEGFPIGIEVAHMNFI